MTKPSAPDPDRWTHPQDRPEYRNAPDCPDCGKSTEGSEEWSTGLCDDCHLDHGREPTGQETDDLAYRRLAT